MSRNVPCEESVSRETCSSSWHMLSSQPWLNHRVPAPRGLVPFISTLDARRESIIYPDGVSEGDQALPLTPSLKRITCNDETSTMWELLARFSGIGMEHQTPNPRLVPKWMQKVGRPCLLGKWACTSHAAPSHPGDSSFGESDISLQLPSQYVL